MAESAAGQDPGGATRPLSRHGDSDALIAAEVPSFLRRKLSANRPDICGQHFARRRACVSGFKSSNPPRPSHALRSCGDFLLFSWKGRKVNGLRRLKESLGPSGSALTRFRGRFWRPVSDRRFQISGIFGAPRLRPVRSGRRLGFAVGLRLTNASSTERRARSKARRGDPRPRV